MLYETRKPQMDDFEEKKRRKKYLKKYLKKIFLKMSKFLPDIFAKMYKIFLPILLFQNVLRIFVYCERKKRKAPPPLSRRVR